MGRLEFYIPVGKDRLRCGFTTGTCAAAAARGAAQALLTGAFPPAVTVTTPAGVDVTAELTACRTGPDWAECAVVKDGGDDPDVTDGLPITVRVARRGDGLLTVDGGAGVGRVTRPGLDQPPGAAAINSVPRRMILEQLEAARAAVGADTGLSAVVSVPGGAALAKRTFNPRLGIEGGISILGTSGIVRPMSESALVDSILLELEQARAEGVTDLLVTPGNYGLDFAQQVLHLDTHRAVSCSNYLGAVLDRAAALGFASVLLVGHLGKLAKLAAGAMNTHSNTADGRREALCTHTALCGGDTVLVRAIFEAATTDAALELLEAAGALVPVPAPVLGGGSGAFRPPADAGLCGEREGILCPLPSHPHSGWALPGAAPRPRPAITCIWL